MPKVSGLPTDTTVTDDDYVIALDMAGPTLKRITFANFATAMKNKIMSVLNLSNPHKFSVYCSTSPSIASTTTKVPLNTELFDTSSNFDNATNYRFTVPETGFYRFNGQVHFSTAGAGTTEYAIAAIYKNGSLLRQSARENGSGDANKIPAPQVSGLFSLTAGDYIELYILTGGTYRAISGGQALTYLDGQFESKT